MAATRDAGGVRAWDGAGARGRARARDMGERRTARIGLVVRKRRGRSRGGVGFVAAGVGVVVEDDGGEEKQAGGGALRAAAASWRGGSDLLPRSRSNREERGRYFRVGGSGVSVEWVTGVRG